MRISFEKESDRETFKEFVCENKALLKQFFAFGGMMRNPLIKLVFKALSEALDIICP